MCMWISDDYNDDSDNHLLLHCYHSVMHYCNHPWLTLRGLQLLRLLQSGAHHTASDSTCTTITFSIFFILFLVDAGFFFFSPLACCPPPFFFSLQRGLKCGPFVWVMLICWGNECINFISTWPQSNNYQSRCVTSNHVKICQLIIKILFWGTWIWHESPREGRKKKKKKREKGRKLMHSSGRG